MPILKKKINNKNKYTYELGLPHAYHIYENKMQLRRAKPDLIL